MSVRTALQTVLINTPNLGTGGLHLLYSLGAGIAALTGNDELHQQWTEAGDKITEASIRREERQKDRLTKIREREKQAAEKDAEIAQAAAPLIQERAAKISEKKVTEHKVESDLRVLKEKEQGDFKVAAESEKLKTKSVHTQTTHQIEEQEITHRTEDTRNLQEHYDTMTGLHEEAKDVTSQATTSANQNTKAITDHYKALQHLTKAVGEVTEANKVLHKNLSELDSLMAAGTLDAEKEKAISEALLSSMQAEKELEKVIATTSIEHRSALTQDFMQDMAERKTQVDNSLHSFSKQTLEKLSELIEAKITESQEQLETLTEEDDIQEIQPQIDKLVAMRDKVQEIALTKLDPHASFKL